MRVPPEDRCGAKAKLCRCVLQETGIVSPSCKPLHRQLLLRLCRAYQDDNSVGKEYDAWTNEGILEAYWGEHIHLGYYNDQVLLSSNRRV